MSERACCQTFVKDHRQTLQARQRARTRLEEMPGQMLIAGLSATFADEALRFVREFDVAEHDPALTYRCKNTFLHRARVLFSEGRIWESRNTDISEADATPLDIVWHQARTAPALYYDTDCKART